MKLSKNVKTLLCVALVLILMFSGLGFIPFLVFAITLPLMAVSEVYDWFTR